MYNDRQDFYLSKVSTAIAIGFTSLSMTVGQVPALANSEELLVSPESKTFLGSANPKRGLKKDFLDESVIANEKNVGSLSDGAMSLAKDLQILDALTELQTLRLDPVQFDTFHALHLRQDVTERLVEAFFDVQGSIAAIDDEIDHTQRLQDEMSDQRDSAIRKNNILNFATTGTLSILSGSFQLRPMLHFQNASDISTIVSGGVATTLSAYALKQQSGGRRSSLRDPNMLAQILGRAVPIELQLPDTVWTYLSNNPPGASKSRKSLLIDKWVEGKRFAAPETKAGLKDINVLSNSTDLHKEVTIEMLGNRIIMLTELKVTLCQMSRDTQVIMKLYRHPH